MIWVARRFSRAICMVKNPVVKPEKSATVAVPTIPMATDTSAREKAAMSLRRSRRLERVTKFLIFITTGLLWRVPFSRRSAIAEGGRWRDAGAQRTGHSWGFGPFSAGLAFIRARRREESRLTVRDKDFRRPALRHLPCVQP